MFQSNPTEKEATNLRVKITLTSSDGNEQERESDLAAVVTKEDSGSFALLERLADHCHTELRKHFRPLRLGQSTVGRLNTAQGLRIDGKETSGNEWIAAPPFKIDIQRYRREVIPEKEESEVT